MKLDPVALFQRLASDIPNELHGSLFVTGSLAAAYHFQAQLEGRVINRPDSSSLESTSAGVWTPYRAAAFTMGAGWETTVISGYRRAMSSLVSFAFSS